jgi:hypothetical protein
MNAKDAMLQTYQMSKTILDSYLGDLTDADLLVRPVAGQNHIAWQLGHLISSERHMIEKLKPGSSPPLPAGFDEAHNRDSATIDDPKKFHSKAEYLKLMQAQRDATIKVLQGMSDAELDAPNPGAGPVRMLPTVGSVLNLVGNHVMMHVGQFVSVRRKLNKPVTI